jgi:hypothetical protein
MDDLPLWKLPLSNNPPIEPPEPPALRGEIRRVRDIGPREREEMRLLMGRYFENVGPDPFERDVNEKEWAILLREEVVGASAPGAIRGFSTLMRLEAEVQGERIVAFFSGDTIIERAFWGRTLLPRLWARHVFELAAIEKQQSHARTFWFLIASGYKTYRFLPVFFRRFFPRFDVHTPRFEARALEVLGARKFGAQFDAQNGIVQLHSATPLREGVAHISSARLGDPHVAFFARANPGHARGDELACLCEIAPENLSRAGKRMLEADARLSGSRLE